MFSQNNCLKRFAYLLKHDSHLGIDQDVSTAYCRSSSGDSVDLSLNGTISTTAVPHSWLAGFDPTIVRPTIKKTLHSYTMMNNIFHDRVIAVWNLYVV